MNKKLIVLPFLTALLALPFVVFATVTIPATPGNDLNIDNVINGIIGFIWPIFGAFAVVMFIWAGVLFLIARGDPSKVSSARLALMWGVIGVAVALLSSSIAWIVLYVLDI